MIHDVQYSLIRFIEENVPSLTAVHWIYDGIVIPIDAVQPYSTVEFMVDEISMIAKDPTAKSDIRFQIGIVDDVVREQYATVSKIKHLLMFESVPLFNTDGDLPVAAGTIQFAVNDITSLKSERIDEESKFNRTYMDVMASVTYHK